MPPMPALTTTGFCPLFAAEEFGYRPEPADEYT
jgi:hypothetical protein